MNNPGATRIKTFRLLLFIICLFQICLAQTGTIIGMVTDKGSDEPLVGAEVVLTGANLGATTDIDGRYVIPNVPPGTYRLQATYIGYSRVLVEDVKILLHLTTTINIALQESVIEGEEITVVAEQLLVKPALTANIAHIDASSLENLPIAAIEDALKLQAGIEPDLTIRGGDITSVSFLVDGINLREGRSNAPIAGLSFTALEQMQVQTGGFDAEFGNVRSGLIQVATKSPSPERYSVDVFLRYRPRQDLNFENPSPDNLDQQSRSFDDPGYDIDVTVGGPLIPGGRGALGNLRFLGSYRQIQEPYVAAFDRNNRNDQTAQLKLISDISSKSMLTLTGLYGNQEGISDSVSSMMAAGVPPYPWGFDNDFFKTGGLFRFNDTGLSDIEHLLLAATLTHTINPNTVLEFKLNRTQSDYFLRPGAQETFLDRDTSKVTLWTGRFDVTRQLRPGSFFKAGLEYINSNYQISSEINEACSTRAYPLGSAANLICLDRVDRESPSRIYESWNATPHQAAAYAQTKLDLRGMVLNLGLRLDYFYPGGNRFVFEEFSEILAQQDVEDRAAAVETEKPDQQLALSPRFGFSFPVTEKSKFYLNYGHFRQMPEPEFLYAVQQKSFFAGQSAITQLGDPNNPMPKTVAYEFGFDQSIAEEYLLRISGYLRDVDNQTSFLSYIRDDIAYTVAQPFNYNDVRGLELTFSKVKGRWFRGFMNFTYMSFTNGNFGDAAVIYNPLNANDFELITQDHYQEKTDAQPYANINLEFFTPGGFGPDFLGGKFFANWGLDILGEWRAGRPFNWNGPIVDVDPSTFGVQYVVNSSLQNNVRTKDFYRLDLRINKRFYTGSGSMQFFIDLTNIFNFRFLYFERSFAVGLEDPFGDYNNYMSSLHLPADAFSSLPQEAVPLRHIPGNDRPGDFRKEGVAYVPIEVVENDWNLPPAGNPAELMYSRGSSTYFQYQNGSWQTADAQYVQQVLDDKAYINMPDNVSQTFLNPRSVRFGVRFSF